MLHAAKFCAYVTTRRAADNPFVGKSGYLPEIYAIGVRSPQGSRSSRTGDSGRTSTSLGGDEINVIKAAATTAGRS